MTKDGNTEAEIKTRISKAAGAFAALKNIFILLFWKRKKISKKTKIRVFKSNVLSVLLYAAESRKVTKGICHMLEVFQHKCPRIILHIFFQNTLSNTELYERTGMLPISLEDGDALGMRTECHRISIPRVAMR